MSQNHLEFSFKEIDPKMNQDNKQLVLEYQRELERASADTVASVIANYTTPDYLWHGIYPFEEQKGAEAVAETFYKPFLNSFEYLQRRPDIFLGGESVYGGNWVNSTGHFLGMFERNWLGIPSTGKIVFLRYCEFHRIENGKIAETYFHSDLMSIMNQAGVNPMPPQTGAEFIWPGPKTHDGIVLEAQDAGESAKTLELIQRMAYDLGANPEVDMAYSKLAETWHDDMIWYGPSGIGSTLSIGGFKRQHQTPFRKALYSGRIFNGHKARFTEGHYGGWVGWPSLSLTVKGGGFMGLLATNTDIDMRVVDMYRREGDLIAENWVFIDMPYILKQQGLDIFERMRELYRT